MFVFHVTVELKPGGEAAYEAWKIAEGELQGVAPGFIKRMLLKDEVRERVYHYVSCWTSDEARLAFQDSGPLQAMLEAHNPSATYATAPAYAPCRVVVDQVARLSPAKRSDE